MKNRQYRSPNLVTQNLTLLVWGLVFLWLVFSQIHLLRPIADDYCAASVSDRGPFVAVVDYFQNWWGDATSLFFYSLFVGVPLRFFGDAVGSIIPFLILNITVFFLGSYFYSHVHAKQANLAGRLLSGAFFLTAWLTFWQSWGVFGQKSPFEFQSNLRMLSAAMIHWKTVQITYVFTSILLAFLFILNYYYPTKKRQVFFYAIIGLAIGMSSYIFAISFGITVLVYFMKHKQNLRFNFKDLLVFGISSCSGFLISFLSPGSTSRRLGLENYPIPELSLRESFDHWVGTMASFLISGSFAYSLIAGALFYSLFLSNLRNPQDLKRTLEIVPYVGTFLVAASFVTALANYHIGWSAWHSLYWAESIWFFGFFYGMKWVSNKSGFVRSKLFSNALLGFCLVISLTAAFSIRSSISDRWISWEKGPAPVAGIEDREVEWVQTCINTRIYSN